MIKYALFTLALLACTASAQGGCRGATSSLIVFKCTGSWNLWTVVGEGGQTIKHSPNDGTPGTFPEDNNPGDLTLNGWPTLAPQIDGSMACGAGCNSERAFLQAVINSADYQHCPANLKAGGADHNNLCAAALMKTRITGTNAAHTILGFKYESVFWNAAIGFLPTGFVTGMHTTTDGGKHGGWHGMMTWPWEFIPNLFDKVSNSLVVPGMGRMIATQSGLISQQVSGGAGRQVVDVVDIDERRGDAECEPVGGKCDWTGMNGISLTFTENVDSCEAINGIWTDTGGGGLVNHKRATLKGSMTQFKDAGKACQIDQDADGRP